MAKLNKILPPTMLAASLLTGCGGDNSSVTNVTFATTAEATAPGTFAVVRGGEKYRVNPTDDNGQLVCTEGEPVYGEGMRIGQHGVGVFKVGIDPDTNTATYVRVPPREALEVVKRSGSVCVEGKITD